MTQKNTRNILIVVVALAALLATAHVLANSLNLTDLLRSIHGG